MDPKELAELEKMVTKAAEEIENRLSASLGKAIEGINAKVNLNVEAANELQANAKVAMEAMPNLIREHVESQLSVNLKGIVEEVGKQFEGKVKAMAGGDSAGGSMGLRDLLAESDKIIGVINAWKQPTTEAAMLSQMNFVMKWHGLLSKLEKGGGVPDDITKAIASTFTEKQE